MPHPRRPFRALFAVLLVGCDGAADFVRPRPENVTFDRSYVATACQRAPNASRPLPRCEYYSSGTARSELDSGWIVLRTNRSAKVARYGRSMVSCIVTGGPCSAERSWDTLVFVDTGSGVWHLENELVVVTVAGRGEPYVFGTGPLGSRVLPGWQGPDSLMEPAGFSDPPGWRALFRPITSP